MAKNAPVAMEYKPSIHLDFDKNAKEVEGLAVGQKVSFTISGTIKGVEQRESYDDPKKLMASVCLKDFKIKVNEAENFADKMGVDEEDD